jgi:putative mRNA 3-end processing factor
MALRPEDLLIPTAAGLYCPPADVFIDPVRPVTRALVTHGHADHARAGHGAVAATPETLDIMAIRYGEDFTTTRQPVSYGGRLAVNDVSFAFHPAGHVLGSAQIAVSWRGLTITVSGDYKDVADPTCTPFAPVRSDIFITEATFGLPVFRHGDPLAEIGKLQRSRKLFPDRTHIVGAYALGKAQRVMALVRQTGDDRPIYIHGALERITAYYVSRGIALGDIRKVAGAAKQDLAGALVIAPPGSTGDVWSRRFADPLIAHASGWMRVRARARQRGAHLPLVISDHCDWEGLTRAIPETGATEIWVTHGQEDALVHWAALRQLRARPLRLVGYGEDDAEREEVPA